MLKVIIGNSFTAEIDYKASILIGLTVNEIHAFFRKKIIRA